MGSTPSGVQIMEWGKGDKRRHQCLKRKRVTNMRNDYKEKTKATNSGHIWRGMGAIGWHESLSLLPSNIKEKIGEKMKRRGPGCPHTTPCSNGWSQFNTLSFYMVRSSSSSSSPFSWGSSPPPPRPQFISPLAWTQ